MRRSGGKEILKGCRLAAPAARGSRGLSQPPYQRPEDTHYRSVHVLPAGLVHILDGLPESGWLSRACMTRATTGGRPAVAPAVASRSLSVTGESSLVRVVGELAPAQRLVLPAVLPRMQEIRIEVDATAAPQV